MRFTLVFLSLIFAYTEAPSSPYPATIKKAPYSNNRLSSVRNKETFLHLPIINGADKETLASILSTESSEKDLNAKNYLDQTALHVAAYVGNYEACEYLIELGIDLNKGDKTGATALFYATSANNLKMVNLLLRSGIDVNRTDNQGKIALHVAAENGFVEVFKTLLLSTDHNKRYSTDNNLWNPYHFAAHGGHHEIIRILTYTKWPKNKCNSDGKTPLLLAIMGNHTKAAFSLIAVSSDSLNINRSREIMYAAQYGRKSVFLALIHEEKGYAIECPYLHAIFPTLDNPNQDRLACERSTEMLKALILDEVDPDAVMNRHRCRFYCTNSKEAALRRGNYSAYLLLTKEMAVRSSRVLAKNFIPELHYEITEPNPALERIIGLITNENINETDYLGRAAIHLAVETNNFIVVRALIAAKCNLSCKNARGDTALHLAKNGAMAEILINANPSLANIPDEEGNLALQKAVYNQLEDVVQVLAPATTDLGHWNHRMYSALDAATIVNNLKIAECLLEHGAGQKIKPGYHTPMHSAAFKGLSEMVHLLKKYDLKMTTRDIGGMIPAHYAINFGKNEELIRILMEGVKPDATDIFGHSFLHYAVICGRRRRNIIKLLAKEFGVPVNLKTFRGKTALHIAAKKSYEDNVRALIECGANTKLTTKKGKTALHLVIESLKRIKRYMDPTTELLNLLSVERSVLKIRNANGLTPVDILFEFHEFSNVKKIIVDLKLTPEDVPKNSIKKILFYHSESFVDFIEALTSTVTFLDYVVRGIEEFKISNRLNDNSKFEDFVSKGFGIFYMFAAAYYPELASLEVPKTRIKKYRKKREEYRAAVTDLENACNKPFYVNELRFMLLQLFLNGETRKHLVGTYMDSIPLELVEDALVTLGNNGDVCGRMDMLANTLMFALNKREDINRYDSYLLDEMIRLSKIVIPN